MKTLINITSNKWAEDIVSAINSTNLNNNRYVTLETEGMSELFVHALSKTNMALPVSDSNLTVSVSELNGALSGNQGQHIRIALKQTDKLYFNT